MTKKQTIEMKLLTAKAQEEEARLRVNRISIYRLIAAIVSLLGLAIGVADKNIAGLFIFLTGSIVFVILLGIHADTKEKWALKRSEREVFEAHISRFGDEWKQMLDCGRDFSGRTTVADDLDLFGNSSVFQYINTGHTTLGKERLADWLTMTEHTFEGCQDRQEAVRELAQKEEFNQKMQILSQLFNNQAASGVKEDLSQFISYMKSGNRLFSLWVTLLSYLLPLGFVSCLVLGYLGIVPYVFAGGIFLLQLVFGFVFSSKINLVIKDIAPFLRTIELYEKMLEAITIEEFSSSYLNHLQSNLLKGIVDHKPIRKLNGIGECLLVRFNPILHGVLAGSLMWDFQCLMALERWRVSFGAHIEGWFEGIGQMEALISLTTITQVNEAYCFPTLLPAQSPYINITKINHPLILEEKAIPNSLRINRDTCVITGSNMSGKTTFLRSIGVNLCLAYAGGPVTAKDMDVSIMRIFTSMRVHDDVSQGISTFYAEILRIKDMVDYCREQKPMLALIDEIFKGTNTADRVVGAKAVIEELSKPNCAVLVSTHDFELCDLEDNKLIHAKNYHFGEYYEQNRIKFDYKMKKGRCKTTNAKHLMKMAGIIT